jgi:hypothetical protein
MAEDLLAFQEGFCSMELVIVSDTFFHPRTLCEAIKEHTSTSEIKMAYRISVDVTQNYPMVTVQLSQCCSFTLCSLQDGVPSSNNLIALM